MKMEWHGDSCIASVQVPSNGMMVIEIPVIYLFRFLELEWWKGMEIPVIYLFRFLELER